MSNEVVTDHTARREVALAQQAIDMNAKEYRRLVGDLKRQLDTLSAQMLKGFEHTEASIRSQSSSVSRVHERIDRMLRNTVAGLLSLTCLLITAFGSVIWYLITKGFVS